MDQFLGEIRLVGFTFAPAGWALCNGQLLSIAQFDSLFNLIGATYGGDGVNSFALPDLRSRVPIHQGAGGGGGYALGQTGGSENVMLTGNQLPPHIHPIKAQSGLGTAPSPTNNFFAGNTNGQYQPQPGGSVTGNLLGPAGQTQPHDNIMPYQAVSYMIALTGLYPSSN